MALVLSSQAFCFCAYGSLGLISVSIDGFPLYFREKHALSRLQTQLTQYTEFCAAGLDRSV
jgi:hypothetical protein